jgi:hypothetical protein
LRLGHDEVLVDGGHLDTETAAPMIGEHRLRGRDQIHVDLAARRTGAETRQRFEEHLRGQILGIVLVAHLVLQKAIDRRHMIAIDALPVEREVTVDHLEPAGLPGLRSAFHN